jgi:energy-coupling factor transporter ATP-binding protein EcfA2
MKQPSSTDWPTASSTASDKSTPPSDPTCFLPSLADLLRLLEQSLRQWFDQPHITTLSVIQKAHWLSLLDDLHRQQQLLAVEHPLLLIVLMGGTGVGKSTLLNALAGAAIAPADIQRPTTRDPVVYLHHSVGPERLDPVLRSCRCVSHDREQLRYKVLVDTPDLDSNVAENRERLAAILPLADVVLYVGSQEKYHDQLGWELFRQQRQRRAFAFVLNKWDRCLTDEHHGVRPDQDWLADLHAEGFQQPRLFRTAAQKWLTAQLQHQSLPPPDLPAGEQFQELRQWLEWGLTRREIEAIKARGIEQLLEACRQALEQTTPPDLHPLVPRLRQQWERLLDEAAQQQAATLLRIFEAQQASIELYFQSCDQQRFRGFMAAYLRATRWLRSSGAQIRRPLSTAVTSASVTKTAATAPLPDSLNQLLGWDNAPTTALLTPLRLQDLPHRLLLAAQQAGWPAAQFQPYLEANVPLQQQSQWLHEAIVQALHHVEYDLLQAAGPRRWLRQILVLTANYAPELAFLATAALLLWQLIVQQQTPGLVQLALVVIVPLLVLVTLHLLLHLLMPLDWSGLRPRLEHYLHHQIRQQTLEHWLPLLDEFVRKVDQERQQLLSLIEDLDRTREWIARHAIQAEIAHLYGR